MSGQMLWHGLNYQGVAIVMKMQGYTGKKAAEIFEGIQVMEAAVLPILNKPPKK